MASRMADWKSASGSPEALLLSMINFGMAGGVGRVVESETAASGRPRGAAQVLIAGALLLCPAFEPPAMLLGPSRPGCLAVQAQESLQRPVGIEKRFAGDGDQVRLPLGEDLLRMLGIPDEAHRHGGHAGGLAHG